MAIVTQIDYDTGEPIEIYPTISAAADDNWMEASCLAAKLRQGGGVAVYEKQELKFVKRYA